LMLLEADEVEVVDISGSEVERDTKRGDALGRSGSNLSRAP
jgi:hypothetical protein